jgi:hypothetical protein
MDLDENLQRFKKASPEEKIAVLRMEMIPLIVTIKGHADLIKYGVASNSQEIEMYAQRILDAVDRLYQLKEILYDDDKGSPTANPTEVKRE